MCLKSNVWEKKAGLKGNMAQTRSISCYSKQNFWVGMDEVSNRINNEAAFGLQGESSTFDCRHMLSDVNEAILMLFSSSSWRVLFRDPLGVCCVRLMSNCVT